MAGFDQPDALKRQPVVILRDRQAGGDAVTENLFNNLRHSRGGLSRANDDQPSLGVKLLS